MAARSTSHTAASPITAGPRSHMSDLNSNGKRYREASASIQITKLRSVTGDSKSKLFDQFSDRFQSNRELPLNLILFITSWLEDVGDLARICRTSKLLYYMTLPRLWENVTLHSYNEIRYKYGWPEGVGGASPFATALESLVSRNMGTYVKTLKLAGNWREGEVDDYTKGRVPDGTAMLNVCIRAAIDNCPTLSEFCWELDAKPTKTVYLGLAARKTLTHFTLRMPSSRSPKPTMLIPTIPTLRSLTILGLDPLCYPDDISMLIGGATNLTELKLDFSTRMRREKELSITMEHYFRHIGRHPLNITHLSLSNAYTRVSPESGYSFFEKLEKITFLNCLSQNDPSLAYIDSTWKSGPKVWDGLKYLRSIRTDVTDTAGAAFIAYKTGLEEIYMISPSPPHAHPATASQANTPVPPSASPAANTPLAVNPTSTTTAATPGTPNTATAAATPGTQATQTQPILSLASNISLASDYIAAITTNHGAHLKNLLLNAHWAIGPEVLSHLITSCPNLRQLALGVDLTASTPFEAARSIVSRLPKLYAFRILIPGDQHDEMMLAMEQMGGEIEANWLDIVSREVVREEYKGVRWFGLGNRAFEFLGRYVDEGDGRARRRVRCLSWEEACREVEIFGLDGHDI